MKPRTIRIVYWASTVIFCLMFTADGLAGLFKEQTGQEVMHQLHMPVYLMQLTGLAKVLGAAAILQPWFRTVKEWAFAGFAINFIGAMGCWLLAGYGPDVYLFPLVAIAIMAIPYYFWKRYLALSEAA